MKKQLKRSRNVPKEIQKLVEKQYYFKCIWCGTYLTDRHHIHQFALGGEHTVDNLVLLCPTCHRKVHRGEIEHTKLIERKVNYRNNRLQGNMLISNEQAPKFKIGGIYFVELNDIIVINDVSIISYRMIEDQILLSTQFYSEEGNLIFWMNDNYYIFHKEYRVNSTEDELVIEDSEKKQVLFKFLKNKNVITIIGYCYIHGIKYQFNENGFLFGKLPIVAEKSLDGRDVVFSGSGFYYNCSNGSFFDQI